jgi:predicted ATPase/DNA-binding CsgD family transcriptional regulator
VPRRPHPRPPLPAPATGFIGRESVIKTVLRVLDQPHTRMLTLTGAPGIGKTRLAVEIARTVADTFPDGVCFVPLAEAGRADMVIAAISQALGLCDQGEIPLQEHLLTYLRDKQLLLVLDNLEQVETPAHALGAVLGAGPGITILATSRSRLQVYGEHEFRVPPLALPDPQQRPNLAALAQVEAVALFVQRAQAINADFTLHAENAEAVAELCRRLDGLPLAIELAAARSRLFPPGALRARLVRRLDLLAHGPLDLPARQQTVRGAIDWSYDLLSAAEQRLFRALAVFAGGGALADVEAVCAAQTVIGDTADSPRVPGAADIVNGLESLVSQSLVMQDTQGDGEPRFRMLEIIREYAMERLIAEGERDRIRRRHADHFLARVEEGAALRGPFGRWGVLRLLEREQDNLRAVLDWCADATDPECLVIGLRLMDAMMPLWEARGPLTEARERLDTFRRKLDPAAPTGTEQDRSAVAGLFGALGRVETLVGSEDAGRGNLERSLRLYRDLGDSHAVAFTLGALGHAAMHLGDMGLAVECLAQHLALVRELGDTAAITRALVVQSEVALCAGDLELAAQLHAQAEAQAAQIDDPILEVGVLNKRSYLDAARQQYDKATQAACRVLELGQGWGPTSITGYAIAGLGKIAYEQGRHEQATVFFAAAQAVFAHFGLRLEPPAHVDPTEYERAVRRLRDLLGDFAFEAAWERGRRQTPPQILALARAGLTPPPAKPRSAPGPAGIGPGEPQLTPRELEVLRLVAAGLTNSEAAARLTVTPHTVNMHLRAIYGKLGVTTRTAAARYAAANHLL